jgi:hypothetical protein
LEEEIFTEVPSAVSISTIKKDSFVVVIGIVEEVEDALARHGESVCAGDAAGGQPEVSHSLGQVAAGIHRFSAFA